MKSINPKNGQLIQTYQSHSAEQANRIIEQSHHAFMQWKCHSFVERASLLIRVAEQLLSTKQSLARLISEEMGKPIFEAVAEIEKCADVCRYYAANAQAQLADDFIDTEYEISKVTYQPIGCVLAIMPWNYPFWQVFRFAAPAIMAGNVALLKHADNVQGCALKMQQIFLDAGFPEHIFSTVLVDHDITKSMIEHPLVRAVTITGSTRAGKAVASIAGGVLKKCVLELGGSDAYLILADADIDLAVAKCTQSRLLNAGQSCISAKRFIVHRSVLDEFQEKLIKQFEQQVMGDPLDEATTIGPMARNDLRDALHQQVQDSIKAGAKCLIGGEVPSGDGAYYPPTILSNVKPNMPAFDQELFGPVACIIDVESNEQAISYANQSNFGLGGAVFSQDSQAAEMIASNHIESGACFVNDFVKSDARLPFGGIKESGFGRELGAYGIREFMNIKTVCVAKSS